MPGKTRIVATLVGTNWFVPNNPKPDLEVVEEIHINLNMSRMIKTDGGADPEPAKVSLETIFSELREALDTLIITN